MFVNNGLEFHEVTNSTTGHADPSWVMGNHAIYSICRQKIRNRREARDQSRLMWNFAEEMLLFTFGYCTLHLMCLAQLNLRLYIKKNEQVYSPIFWRSKQQNIIQSMTQLCYLCRHLVAL